MYRNRFAGVNGSEKSKKEGKPQTCNRTRNLQLQRNTSVTTKVQLLAEEKSPKPDQMLNGYKWVRGSFPNNYSERTTVNL